MFMSKPDVSITISLHADKQEKKVENLEINVVAGVKGKVTGNSPLTLHNNSGHPLLIWASRSNKETDFDSIDFIDGWAQRTRGKDELRLDDGEQTEKTELRIKRKDQTFRFWLHVSFGDGAAHGDDGGGLTKSVEIEVTPP
jgi:hypothetical protein